MPLADEMGCKGKGNRGTPWRADLSLFEFCECILVQTVFARKDVVFTDKGKTLQFRVDQRTAILILQVKCGQVAEYPQCEAGRCRGVGRDRHPV